MVDDPSSARASEVSLCLADLNRGDSEAVHRLLPHIYADLREIAGRVVQGAPGNATLQPTALVHEAYLRLVGKPDAHYNGRLHFMSVAAMAMRQVLSNYARDRRAQKRGGPQGVMVLEEAATPIHEDRGFDLVALDDALTELQKVDARQAKTVELRYLAGLTNDETATVLGVSPRTVRADWYMARHWLQRALGGE
ncbi:MAG: ECF-type sigma factor [Planctomycetota bacterium]